MQLENEKGEILEHFNINFADIYLYVLEAFPDRYSTYPWLEGIDEYGDTFFNFKQIPHVITELEKLRIDLRNHKFENLDESIIEVMSILKRVKQHIYIRFIGD